MRVHMCVRVSICAVGREREFLILKKYGLSDTFLPQAVCTSLSHFLCSLGGRAVCWDGGAGNVTATKLPFPALCAIMATSVSHLLGSVSFLPI